LGTIMVFRQGNVSQYKNEKGDVFYHG